MIPLSALNPLNSLVVPGGGSGLRRCSIHQPASINAMLISPEPPRPTPTGPIVLTAMASATINTIVLVCDCELCPLPTSDSAADDSSPAALSSSHASR